VTTDPRNEDYHRGLALEAVRDSAFVAAIRMEMWPKPVGYGALDDCYDEDGDSIVARSTGWFPVDGEGLVQAVFAQGSDPKLVPRVLRKFAEMLDGPEGYMISKMGLGKYDLDFAQRLEGGRVSVVCRRRELEEHDKWKEEEGGD